MLTVKVSRRNPEIHRVMDAPDDAFLLERVARNRDKAAFDALYQKYEKKAFNLAYHLTGNAETAKDAVQEAMLDLWRKPQTGTRDLDSGWIMRIVANKSISMVRKQTVRRNQKSRESGIDQKSEAYMSSPAPEVERE